MAAAASSIAPDAPRFEAMEIASMAVSSFRRLWERDTTHSTPNEHGWFEATA